MGKISPVSSKYIVNASIEIDGVVDRPDVIGAIFGQTEGLLGAELELRELQRSGRIGRIEVNIDTKGGKSAGAIIIPSSLDKAETAIIAAALEIIQRIGPCNAKVKVQNIEDVRVSKRTFVMERAKELLRNLMDQVMPDSQELAEEVVNSVRVMECVEYGKDRLPAGPGVEDSDEVIVVEGRADVLCLLKNGFKNVIAMNGTSIPPTIVELSKKKDIIAFVDGDRGGDLIIKDLLSIAEVDFVTRAPDGKEVEELTKKEVHKALRSKITAEQARLEQASPERDTSQSIRKGPMMRPMQRQDRPLMQTQRPPMPVRPAPVAVKRQMNPAEKARFTDIFENLIGTRGACLLDEKLNVLGKVPIAELPTTIQSLGSGVYAIVFDGTIEPELVRTAEKSNVRHLIGLESKVNPAETPVNLLTSADL